jgi:orotidine-5'-phosphate decarboxylase
MGTRPVFTVALARRWHDADTRLCVGLDPDPARLPAPLRGRPDALFAFCAAIVDATADLVCAFKPQIACFASQRAEDQLEQLIAHIHRAHPQVPVILDAKRGDIGSTAEHYAREAFERYAADAVTLSPYMGLDSIAPFLAYPGRGAFVLCRTSNPGGDALQMLEAGGQRVFERVAHLAATQWNLNGQIGLVVGATYPAELARVRAIAPQLPLLVPGVGAQGGDIQALLEAEAAGAAGAAGAAQAAPAGPRGALVINSSRAILYAGSGEDYAAAARVAALRTRDEIRRHQIGQPLTGQPLAQ